ncbi:hypothetical protein J4G52_24410 [Burkholderia cenocepacia]|uniref:hypothetical protein n=1 Tax=Burkholderia cenocepacia TaxID=95486 RepID=UPI001AA1381C|nr:hypothetical protein [Burkholderia cenocepacia]MBO1856685.1 hypothetical protein [Burkholderia cenocepacia]
MVNLRNLFFLLAFGALLLGVTLGMSRLWINGHPVADDLRVGIGMLLVFSAGIVIGHGLAADDESKKVKK